MQSFLGLRLPQLGDLAGWFFVLKTIQLCLCSLVTEADGETAYAVTPSVLHSQCCFWRTTEGKGLTYLSCSRIQLFPGKTGKLDLSLLGSETSRRLPPWHHPRRQSNSSAVLGQPADPSCPILCSQELLAPGSSTVNGEGEWIMLSGCLLSQPASIFSFSHCHLAQWLLTVAM